MNRKVNIKIIKDNFLVILFVIYCFYSYGLRPFFTWETFADGILDNIRGISLKTLITILLFGYGCFYTISMRIKRESFMYALCITFFGIIIVIAGGSKHILSFEILIYLIIAFFVLFPDKIQILTYRTFYIVFVFSLIIPIIIYILVNIGINVPNIIIESPENIKQYMGITYKIYPLASQWTTSYNPTYYGLRLCGIYNEPGVVGTYAALFLCVEKYKLRGNWKNIVLLIGGILSLSVAFYVMTAIYFLVQMLSAKPKRIIAIICVSIMYIVFINYPFENVNIQRFQNRLIMTSDGLSGDNRTNMAYDEVFNELLKDDPFALIFGRGDSAMESVLADRNIDGSSYKSLICNYGILGFLGQIIWLLLYSNHLSRFRGNNHYIYIFSVTIVLLANMYQRPFMFALPYYVIFIGGLKNNLLSKEII